jgi:hypothetical protein
MGMFDEVFVPCPKCNKGMWFQSKGGDQTLSQYTLENVPDDVFSDINRHAPMTCTDCGTLFFVGVKKEILIWETTYNPNDLDGEENND